MLSELVDDFIGRRFGINGHLEVIGRSSRVGKNFYYYDVKCQVCSEDSSMHGDGIFQAVKGNLEKGCLPCACSKSYKRTLKQSQIEVERFCEGTDYTFVDFKEKQKGKDIKLVMFCKSCEDTWDTTTLHSFLAGNGCPKCRNRKIALKNKKSDKELIDSFNRTGAYIEGTKFTRSDRLTKAGCKSFWNMYCPICSVDEYVKAGVCSGVFESFSGSFQTGMLPCRCSKSYYYTREQREWKIKDILSKRVDGITFSRWLEKDWKWTKARFELICPVHKEFIKDVNNFINCENYTCPSCATYGFSVHKQAYLYVFRAVPVSDDTLIPFTGYGITNSLDTRFCRHEKNFKDKGFIITRPVIYSMSGLSARELEKKIQKKFPIYSQDIEGFKTEATYGYLYKYVRYFIDDNLPEGYINEYYGTEDNDSIREVLQLHESV